MLRPFVSFCIVAYNEEKYIAEAIDGAFSQTYPDMEIIISDDHSSDRTWEIILEKTKSYKGPHKIVLNSNEKNLGPRDHFNKVFYELAKGEIIVVAAGDDISRADRVSVCVDLMMSHPDVMSMSVESRRIDVDGNEIPKEDWNKISNGKYSIFTLADYISYGIFIFSGDSRVIRRRVIEAFPPLTYSYSEDIFIFIRSFYLGSVLYLREPLVSYRQRRDSIMGKAREKKNSREDQIRFQEITQRQIEEDFNYAVNKGYLSIEEVEFAWYKIKEVIRWLRPKRRTIWWRMVNKASKTVNKHLDSLLLKLE